MKHQISKFALATAIATVLATPAYAQSSADKVDDIVVTARRVEERLQDVPISITVFNQQQLSDRNVTTGQDLAAYTPSLSTEGRFGSISSSFAIRGFTQEIGTSPSVGVYFGEVVAPRGPAQSMPAGDGAGPGMFFDLQNVQVLKGPQGTLFGRNTTGGAVVLVPQKPTDKLEGYVEGSLGNYSMERFQGVLNAPLADTVRLRLGVDRQTRKGYMKNLLDIGPRDFDDIDYTAARASLVIDVTPDIETYTIASYTNSKTHGHSMKLAACNPALAVPATAALIAQACDTIDQQDAEGFHTMVSDMPTAHMSLRQWQVINNTSWRVNDNLTVRNIISYGRLWTELSAPNAGTNFEFFGYPLNLFVVAPLPGGKTSNHQTFTEEFRIEGKSSDSRLNYQAGVYYERVTPKGLIGVQTTSNMYCADPAVTDTCVDITGSGGLTYSNLQSKFGSMGLYAQATYEVVDNVKLTGGIRYTWDRASTLTHRFTYAFSAPGPFGPWAALPFNVDNYVAAVEDPGDLLPPPNAKIGDVTRCTEFWSFGADTNYGADTLCEQRVSKKWNAPTWTLGIDYNPTPDVLLYAKYTRGYRTGSIKADLPTPFKSVEPEKVDTFEIGAKTSFNGAVRGNFNIAAFYNNFRNQQLQVSFLDKDLLAGNPSGTDGISYPPAPGLANLGKSRIWGIEADARLHLFEGFTLDAGYAYLNTKVLNFEMPAAAEGLPFGISAEIKKGYPLIYSPKHKLTLTGTYHLPIDESVGDVSISATYTYTAKQLYSYNGLSYAFLEQPEWDHSWLGARNLLNLNLNWNNIAGKPVDLGLFATNVTNKKYYVAGFGLSSYGMEAASAAEPRMFGARVRVRFGGE